MTGAVLALLVASALASPLDVERGRAALESGRIAEARDDLQRALADDSEDVDALHLYVRARRAEGASALVLAELAGLAAHSVAAGVVHDEIAVEQGADPKLLSDRKVGPGSDLAVRALAGIALRKGAAEIALASLREQHDPLDRSLRLAALVAAGQDAQGLAEGRKLAHDLPDRPDLLLPLAGAGSSGPAGRGRALAVRVAERLAKTSQDPVALYRARRVLVRAGEKDAAAAVVKRLVALGEPAVLARAPYGAATRGALARRLAQQRDPQLPDGTPAEVRDIALRLATLLQDTGRVQEAVAVFDAARKRADCTRLALAESEQLLRMDRAKEALAAARDARRLASEPSDRDVGREDLDAWRGETAASLQLEAGALAALDRPEDALQPASTAALLEPSAEAWTLVGQLDAKLGDPRAAFTAFSAAHLLGGDVSDALAGTWTGLGAPGAAVAAVEKDLARQLGVPVPKADLASPPPASGPKVGAPAPPFHVQAASRTFDSDSERGRVVVLAFFASWCGPCRLELPELARLAKDHAKDPVDFLAVSIDDSERDYTRYLARAHLDGLVLARDPALGSAWGVRALPALWIVDKQGVLRHRDIGYVPGGESAVEIELEALLEP